ncbi:1,4-alpha-glucan branching enzyme [Polaribacter sp. Hel1_33_78]|jgi:1,4-alpha-glucan branching enzyme|uniref:1,4-alpha-glucan branching protein GlgB n=1 Tax=unclassified Polaribacter TaxID=196858 RepID=UPI00052D7E3B|nr:MULTISPECIES: 1,4-alpha-glucan branching protein GlgB [unclassified Polaribacter]KGL61332.1 1,4-alpha-glucan branching enzyme, CBM48 domain protein, GH13-9 family [Polaribacter sp. Hel1_33_49]MBT4414381.1 1,4-alpha-glucan branching protein GlgB [Polaribacter sp.]PKV65475.1 1,4-alpha-glucan branching enzyme [Polaribacter sp. Hel1_33_96]SDT94403.1 1,4-alpha-glucan branching enzyme [Polaribacter sp. Hel1_33_78]
MAQTKIHSLFTEFDIHLFQAGKHYRLYEKFGSHITTVDGIKGTYFAVWAPSAKSVAVIGDFNFWLEGEHHLNVRWDGSGIWEGFIPEVSKGSIYKYKIRSSNNDITTEKADPFARRCEHPPKTASVVWEDEYAWKDKKWMKNRKKNNALDAPFSVYEVHLGSWKKQIEENRFLSYRELAEELVDYVEEMNFTHVEFMPIMEYPYDPSWGYQLTGYFAPTSRFGYPDEFKYLVDKFHEKGIGVLLDWVPSHFPSDDHGLGFFDGSHLYEHPDRRKGYHQDWKSLIFNYGRNEIKAFLISNAIFWLDQYHADGLRVDAVASMLFLDYSREEGQWEPNEFGGRENLDAINFIKEMNAAVYEAFPDVQTIAEESTSFPQVSRPIYDGGLGFGMKWMMGWMHDTLDYFAKEPVYRKHHQNDLTFSLNYAFTENFMLPLSHDEVVYGKKSIVDKMPGDEWQKFGNLRLLYGFMYTHPGAKLLFQGGEFGQTSEWNFNGSLDWHLLNFDVHKGAQNLVKDLNKLYKKEPALHQKQFSPEGFEWIDHGDHENSVMSYLRKGINEKDNIIVVLNLTPVPREHYRIGLPKAGALTAIFNSDAIKYNGSGKFKNKKITSDQKVWNARENSIELNLPPLGMMVYKYK